MIPEIELLPGPRITGGRHWSSRQKWLNCRAPFLKWSKKASPGVCPPSAPGDSRAVPTFLHLYFNLSVLYSQCHLVLVILVMKILGRSETQNLFGPMLPYAVRFRSEISPVITVEEAEELKSKWLSVCVVFTNWRGRCLCGW